MRDKWCQHATCDLFMSTWNIKWHNNLNIIWWEYFYFIFKWLYNFAFWLFVGFVFGFFLMGVVFSPFFRRFNLFSRCWCQYLETLVMLKMCFMHISAFSMCQRKNIATCICFSVVNKAHLWLAWLMKSVLCIYRLQRWPRNMYDQQLCIRIRVLAVACD